jgi:hypothetical protein
VLDGGRGMSRWYVASKEIVGERRREDRKGERWGDWLGLEEKGFRVSIMRRVSVRVRWDLIVDRE